MKPPDGHTVAGPTPPPPSPPLPPAAGADGAQQAGGGASLAPSPFESMAHEVPASGGAAAMPDQGPAPPGDGQPAPAPSRGAPAAALHSSASGHRLALQESLQRRGDYASWEHGLLREPSSRPTSAASNRSTGSGGALDGAGSRSLRPGVVQGAGGAPSEEGSHASLLDSVLGQARLVAAALL